MDSYDFDFLDVDRNRYEGQAEPVDLEYTCLLTDAGVFSDQMGGHVIHEQSYFLLFAVIL